MNHLSFVSRFACAIALGCFALSSVNAQSPITTTIVNDSFADGITANASNQIGFISVSSGAALDQMQAPGPLDFATGDQGRQIGGLFTAQTLAAFGDELDITFSFTTPATVAFDNGAFSDNEDFRFGLFNSTTASGNDAVTMAPFDFTQNISISGNSSAGNQPGTGTIAGFVGEVDNINDVAFNPLSVDTDGDGVADSLGGSDLGIRTNNVTNDAVATNPVGSFLNTTTGFDQVANGTDDIVSFAPNEDYTGTISVAFSDATLTALDITVGIAGTGIDGVAFADTLTDTVLIATDANEVGVNTTTFDLLTFGATTGAFGGTEQAGVPGGSETGEINNGIDITNVTVEFTTLETIPEPGSAGLLLGGLAALGFFRRRK